MPSVAFRCVSNAAASTYQMLALVCPPNTGTQIQENSGNSGEFWLKYVSLFQPTHLHTDAVELAGVYAV